VLISIFSKYSRENQKRLNYLKKIIYSATIKEITTKNGLIREQLFKTVATQFEKMNIIEDKEKVENAIFNIVNCVAFFDEVVMRAFKESLTINGDQAE
jgi:hypothetical protein